MAAGHAERLVEETPLAAVQFHDRPLTDAVDSHRVPLAVRHVHVGQHQLLLPRAQVVAEAYALVDYLQRWRVCGDVAG